MAAAVRAREGTPPPIIGKAGNYTVFITPPATPRPPEAAGSPKTPVSVDGTPRSKLSPALPPKSPPFPSPKVGSVESFKLSGPVQAKSPPSPPPPVQVPPLQFEKSKGKSSSGSAFGFFWDAVAKVQYAHSSLDGYLADWFGLNQSKYQWALNDYYESKGMDKGGKPKDLVGKECA